MPAYLGSARARTNSDKALRPHSISMNHKEHME